MQLLQRTASLPAGSGQCNSCNTLPHGLGAVGSGTPSIASLRSGGGQCSTCNALPHCLGAVANGTPAIHCPADRRHWAMHPLHCPATPPWGCGYWNLCNAPLHCLGAVGGATPAIHFLTASGQWAVELLQGGLGGGSSTALCCAVVHRAVPCCVVLCCALLCCPVLCCAALCCVVLCCAVPCRAMPCCAVLCCVVLWCAVLCCGVPKALLPNGKRPGYLPKGKGKRAGLCVLCARSVCVRIFLAERGGARKILVGTPVATVVIPRAPAAPPLFPLVGADVAPATPTPSCYLGSGGPSAMWRAPWRERTRP